MGSGRASRTRTTGHEHGWGGHVREFQLRADDGSVVVARTMEFPDMLGANLAVIPHGTVLTSESPGGGGARWTSVHRVVGMDAVGKPQWLTDGMNEAALYAGALYMPTPYVVDVAATDFSGARPRQATLASGGFQPITV